VGGIAAFATIVLASLIPGVLSAGTPAALLGIPFEAIALVLLFVVLPSRAARLAAAVVFGALVVTAVVFAALDLAFVSTIDRPFRAVDDWPQLVAAAGVVRDATGVAGLICVIVVLLAAIAGAVWALAAAASRVGGVVATAGRPVRIVAVTVSAAWIAGALVGAQLVPGIPFSAADATRTIAATTEQAALGIREGAAFDRALRTDSLRDSPRDGMLAGLEGKDVVFAFIESYGRVAVEGTTFSTGVERVLHDGGAQLARDGYAARSAFLTSPTFGGVSWLAHATLQSGVWVDSQQKYDRLTASDRITVSRIFAEAGWRTVAVVPANDRPWPVGSSFYGWDPVLDSRRLGYRGPSFSYARIPDQFTWQQFHERELAAEHAPVMAEIDFVSSHTPWTPLPRLVPWADLGDGTVFDPQPAEGEAPVVAWRDARRVQELYGQSIEYSLGALFSYLETYPQPDLVLVVVGDHQPARIVSGPDADHDVPITVIAQDPEVFDRIASWGWDEGVSPSPDAPVWRMDGFRDRFLAAFSDAGAHLGKR
jgi:hypothetical protein